MQEKSTAIIAKKTRWHRKWHRRLALISMVFLLFVSVTGLLLAWKKNSGGLLLADSQKGTTPVLSEWLPFDSLARKAFRALKERHGENTDTLLSRIDARPEKGMVKFVFENHYHAIQMDAATGKVLLFEERRADFIEQLHDGSIFDKLLGSNGPAKLTWSTVAGLSLLLLTITGFWLWYNPRRMKAGKKKIVKES